MGYSRREFITTGSLAAISAPFLISSCNSDNKTRNLNPSGRLYELFRNPASSSRLFVRWWWNGDRITEKEILRELDILHNSGIGGVEINPIRFPDGCEPGGYEPVEWLSDEWIKLLQVTLQGVKDRGMISDIIVGSGWPFGGEFLEKDEQTQLMAFETENLTGPGIRTFKKKYLLDKVDPPIHSKNTKVYKDLFDIRLAPAQMKTFETGIDISDQIENDEITVNIPEGEHILYFLVKLTGYQAVINGASGAAGPVLNHYNKAAVRKYLERMSGRLTPELHDLGDHFRAMFCDSLEMEGANWYDDLPEEFIKRRRYDLVPYFPFILYKIGHMGNPVEEKYGSEFSPEVEEIIQRVRYDFYITRLELFKERFIDTFNNWCHENHVKSRIQSYGRGYHPLDASMSVDIPECETWLRATVGTDYADSGWRGRAYSIINKFVSSAARLAGKKLVSCEEITNTSMVFNGDLQTIKVAGDQSNLSGVTGSVLHGFNYSPPDVPFPGWIQYGTFFNEKNPWWPYIHLWADYKARLSAVFQNAESCTDIAILHPLADLWMKYGPQRDPFPLVNYPSYQHNVWEAAQQNGYGCDYVSESILENATFENGYMKYKSRSYNALILLEVETISSATANAIKRFADAGGKIIFIEKAPYRSPGLKNHTENDRVVHDTIQSVLHDNKQNTGINPAPVGNMMVWFRELAVKFDMIPYMHIHNPDPFINQEYFRYKDLDIFFISHYNMNNSYSLKVEFALKGKIPWIWDPETGERYILTNDNVKKLLTIDFEPAESKLIVFSTETDGPEYQTISVNPGEGKELTGPWEVILQHVNGSERKITLDDLVDFNNDPGLRSFAGVIYYRSRLNISDPGVYRIIDLGKVHGVSEVRLNDRLLGIKWYGFHRYEAGSSLKEGENKIEIKVTTVLGNYIKSLENNPVARRWMSRQEYHSMGMTGPVKLIQI